MTAATGTNPNNRKRTNSASQLTYFGISVCQENTHHAGRKAIRRSEVILRADTSPRSTKSQAVSVSEQILKAWRMYLS